MIRHVWFDMEGTLVLRSGEFRKAHQELLLSTYSEVVGRPVSEELKNELDKLYAMYGSHSAVFRSLGRPSDFWVKRFRTLNDATFYKKDASIRGTLGRLKESTPISIFTNADTGMIDRSLKIIDIEKSWFTFLISGEDIKERKPALEGFLKIVEKSKLPPEEILYVGDRVKADILPAKKVGMKTCLVWSKSSEADYSFERFEDILSIFRNGS